MTHTECSNGVVLVVDDDAVFGERLARAFHSRGLEAFPASTHEEAIRIAKLKKPDLILVDMRLRDEDGLTLIPLLRALNARSAIFVLTGYGSLSTALSAARAGADNYLSKPIDADGILQAYRRFRGETQGPEVAEMEVPSLARVEWEHIQRVLDFCEGNISQAARLLGIHRRSLQRKLNKFPPNR